MFMYYYTVCYFTCIFYAIVRQISMLFIYNKDSLLCILYCQHCSCHHVASDDVMYHVSEINHLTWNMEDLKESFGHGK